MRVVRVGTGCDTVARVRDTWFGPRRSALVALTVALPLLVAMPAARADEALCAGPPPSDDEIVRRLGWIERAVERDEDDVRRWFTAFVVVHALLGGVNAALAFGTEAGADMDSERWWRSPAAPFFVNATGATLGLLTLLLSTPPILGAGDALARLPRGSRAERRIALRLAERRLRRHHDAAAFVRGALASTASALYVAAAGTLLVGLGHSVAGIVHALGGSLLAQGRLLLHPEGPIAAWRAYQSRYPDAGCDPIGDADRDEGVAVEASPAALAPGGWGLAIALTF